MIYEHEIPQGSRLYFGQSAKIKRNIEYKASELLEANGFEEIVTPSFSYSAHQSIEDERALIRLSDIDNSEVSLRADSTLDVVRIITKRLGRSTSHKKWFYAQPVFRYPTAEFNQIGAEWIGHDNVSDVANLAGNILQEFTSGFTVQVSNIKIPKIVSELLDIPMDTFANGKIGELLNRDEKWFKDLVYVQNIDGLEKVINEAPEALAIELKKLKDIAKDIDCDVVVSPLYYASMKYYDEIFFRIIKNNYTLAKGGCYESNGVESQGFALYTDALIEELITRSENGK